VPDGRERLWLLAIPMPRSLNIVNTALGGKPLYTSRSSKCEARTESDTTPVIAPSAPNTGRAALMIQRLQVRKIIGSVIASRPCAITRRRR